MINIRKVKSYCCEDISLIENYDLAINDNTQMYACHHRLEIDLNLSRDELIKRGLYYDRPAPELIFMTKLEHKRLHSGTNHPLYNIPLTEEHKNNISIGTKAAMDKLEVKEKILGDNNVMKRPEVREKNRKSLLKYYETHSSPTKGKHRVYREDGSFYFDW